MEEFCFLCGEGMKKRDTIGWRFFGAICGRCFLPKASIFLEDAEGLELLWRTAQIAPHCRGNA